MPKHKSFKTLIKLRKARLESALSPQCLMGGKNVKI